MNKSLPRKKPFRADAHEAGHQKWFYTVEEARDYLHPLGGGAIMRRSENQGWTLVEKVFPLYVGSPKAELEAKPT